MERNGFVLVRVHGIHDPLRFHGSTLECVRFGLGAGDCMLVFGDENNSFLADPAEVEIISLNFNVGIAKKYQHLEDFHWAVRPLFVALGLFTVMKLGLLIENKVERSKLMKRRCKCNNRL
ncbi:hypothetical protein HAX54_006240 [Datura stramonium]|uniref:Uncharacterized protein n=1 Tax=Datura stramonium TaxID=4076 RepID=A0ABS8T9Z4_DATST|nr:hypothetical protein [Datura stramonium]